MTQYTPQEFERPLRSGAVSKVDTDQPRPGPANRTWADSTSLSRGNANLHHAHFVDRSSYRGNTN